MKVLHVLSSNKYSGAENVACQIIELFDGSVDMAYCSPIGDIKQTLEKKDIKYLPLDRLDLKNLKKAVEEYAPDVIHAHDLRAILITSFLGKQYKKIGHIHVNDKDKMGKITLKSICLNFVRKKFKHFFWVSKSCFDDFYFKSNFVKNSTILYNVINLQAFYDTVNKDSKDYDYDIVYLGRLSYQKNPLRLIEIANQLKQNGNKFKFAIIGDGEKASEIKSKVIELGLDEEIDILGFMNNGYKILSQAKVMLMTSLFEGTPMCALESLAVGTPVVSTKTDGMEQLIKNSYNGFLYSTNDEAVSAIELILKDKKLSKSLSFNSKEFSKEYNDLKNYKEKLFEVYKTEKL